MKEGRYDRHAGGTWCIETVVRPAIRATLGAWSGAAIVAAATFMMRVTSYSAVRTVGFIAAILAGTGLILFSLERGG